MLKLLFQGDSVTDAGRDKRNFHDMGKGYPHFAARLIREALPDAEIERRVASALEAVGLSDAADRYPAELSGGMQKRAGLARAIVRDAEIVLYDEPTSGLDPVTSAVIERLIVDLNRSRGVTSVVVTHDLAMAARTSSRIMLIKDGKSVACLPPDEFMRCGKREVAEFVGAAKGDRK